MKKTLAFLLTLALLATLFAGLSLPVSADQAALTVYVQYGAEGTPEVVKAYSADELAELKEAKEDGYTYVYWKNGEMKTVVATEFVSLDALLSDAGTSFGEGDELKFTCSDGPYPKGDFRYEVMAERGFDAEGNAVPSAFALSYGSTLEAQESTGEIRFVCGATTDEIEAQSAAGARMPSDVVAVTVVKPEPVVIPENPFTDVNAGTYCYDAVLWAVGEEITTGTSATTFSPDKACTRAQMVTFLWRAAGSPEPGIAEHPFTDVKAGYYASAVRWALENGITAGVTATQFGPDSPCSRAQAVTFLWRTKGKPAASQTESPFVDVQSKDDYYYSAVLWAVENGITTGLSATRFGPKNPCTRGQIVTFLYRYFSQK